MVNKSGNRDVLSLTDASPNKSLDGRTTLDHLFMHTIVHVTKVRDIHLTI